MEHSTLSILGWTGLSLALLAAFAFEFVNGFHDTANAVASIIYTKSMRATHAVVLSGICNFLGVFLGGTAVAFTVVHLLPVDLLMNIGSGEGFAMMASLLISAIAWNLGTWYLGLPASSSHTLIGAIIGVGFVNATLNGTAYGNMTTLHALEKVFLALLISPFLGGVLAAVLILTLKRFAKGGQLFEEPHGKNPPPPWIRGMIIASGAGVSFTHGSNDGQKGVGLIMLILIGLMPLHYALNVRATGEDLAACKSSVVAIEQLLDKKEQIINNQITAISSIPGGINDAIVSPLLEIRMKPLIAELAILKSSLDGINDIHTLTPKERLSIRSGIMLCNDGIGDLLATGRLPLSKAELKELKSCREKMMNLVEYATRWVMFGVALSLGLGTMIGWHRIVVTIGEKIGKSKLNYAQGFSAQATAAITILMGIVFGLPVSTTHVLSSGVAGSMMASGHALQGKTLTSIAMAWILTLPAAMLLGGGLFLLLRLIF